MSDERYQRLAHEAYEANGGDVRKAEAALLASVRADHEMLVALTDTFMKNAVASTLYRIASKARERGTPTAKPKATPRGPDAIIAANQDTREAFLHGDKAKQDELLAKARLRTRLNAPPIPR